MAAAHRGGAPRAAGATLLAVGGGIVLVPFLATGLSDASGWTQSLPWQMAPWALAGAGLVLAALAALPRPWSAHADRAHVLAALAALALALLGRWLVVPGAGAATALRVVLAFGPQVLALLALGLALRSRGTPEGRLAARSLAALALLRRLTASDAEFALLAALALLCALGARLPGPASRRGLAALAALLLVVRVAALHASGGSETWGAFDVAQGYFGLEEFVGAAPVAAGAGAGLTSAAGFAGGSAARARVLVGDLALALAARAAALVLCLWTLAANAWWVGKAREVYTLGAGDLVLVLAAALAAGLWRREEADAPRPSPGARVVREPAAAVA
jgi:hypothetical protein